MCKNHSQNRLCISKQSLESILGLLKSLKTRALHFLPQFNHARDASEHRPGEDDLVQYIFYV